MKKFTNEVDKNWHSLPAPQPALSTGTATGTHLPAPEPALELRLTEFCVFREAVIPVNTGISRWLDKELKIKYLFPHVNEYLCAGL